MRIGSLFSGYGGLDLAVQSVLGGDLAWYSEIEPAACKVLTAHHPGVPNLGDITKVNWADVEPVDILTGGYPCQPFSHAGNRKGKNDERHLWPFIADALRQGEQTLCGSNERICPVKPHLAGHPMSHLPECMHSDEWQPYCCPECTPGVVPEWEQVCICDRLRACEERVENRFHFYVGPDVYAAGRADALDAAREAVAALPPSPLPERWGIRTAMNFRGDVLAAIDALREGEK